MDNTVLITLFVNAALTILTTVVVTRISLGKRAFFSGATIKSALARFGRIVFDLVVLSANIYYVGRFALNGQPITKLDIIVVPIYALNALVFLVFSIRGIVQLRTTKA